jgi:hypothetical protein
MTFSLKLILTPARARQPPQPFATGGKRGLGEAMTLPHTARMFPSETSSSSSSFIFSALGGCECGTPSHRAVALSWTSAVSNHQPAMLDSSCRSFWWRSLMNAPSNFILLNIMLDFAKIRKVLDARTSSPLHHHCLLHSSPATPAPHPQDPLANG